MAGPTRSLSIPAFSAAGLLLGASLLPAGTAFAADGCGGDATLIADGICEVTFTETPTSAWTPPAGITTLQALLVGGGGAVSDVGDEYGGGGGEVVLVELSTTGAVDVTVGTGGLNVGNVDSESSVVGQGSTDTTARGGGNSDGLNDFGGSSGNGNLGDSEGSGGGAGGAADNSNAGAGVVVSDIAGGFELFAADDRCFGGGGVNLYSWGVPTAHVRAVSPACGGDNGGWFDFPDTATLNGIWWEFAGTADDVDAVPTLANTGNGGASFGGFIEIPEDGSDGLVAIRYDAALASTGFDVTGAIASAAVLVTAGAIIATRRRKASN
jgi:hypothetical protein